jgi:hypothetical protein
VGWTVLTPEGDVLTSLDMTGGNDGTTGPNGDMNQESDDNVIVGLTGNLYEVGQITDFMDIPNNPCIEVETENGAVILPLHEDFILAIDPEYQEIVLQIPEGLL